MLEFFRMAFDEISLSRRSATAGPATWDTRSIIRLSAASTSGNSCRWRSIRESARWYGARWVGAALLERFVAASLCPPAAGCTRRLNTDRQVADEQLYKVIDALDQVAKETGKTVPQVALNWLLRRPTVSTVIIGARNEEQLRQNLAAEGWSLSPAQVAALDRASQVKPTYPYWHQKQFAERNPFPVALDVRKA